MVVLFVVNFQNDCIINVIFVKQQVARPQDRRRVADAPRGVRRRSPSSLEAYEESSESLSSSLSHPIGTRLSSGGFVCWVAATAASKRGDRYMRALARLDHSSMVRARARTLVAVLARHAR